MRVLRLLITPPHGRPVSTVDWRGVCSAVRVEIQYAFHTSIVALSDEYVDLALFVSSSSSDIGSIHQDVCAVLAGVLGPEHGFEVVIGWSGLVT